MKRTLTITALLAGAAAYSVSRTHRRIGVVAEELRDPKLYVPTTVSNDIALKVGRRLLGSAPPGPITAGVSVQTERIAAAGRPDVRVLVYEPTGRIRPSGALVWIHGGGLIMGTPEQGNALCSRFAAELGIVVVSVDYRLAPEHPFPAGLDDCATALAWTHEHADRLGIDTARIAVGGDSAGGGLAAALAQRAHDDGGPPICFQLLQYPMLDDRTALRDGPETFVWTRSSNRYAWQAYLGHALEQDETRPHAAPARRTDLSGLPPAWIGVGSIDLFNAEDADYAQRLEAAGVRVEYLEVPGMYHAAEVFVPNAPSMVAFTDAMVDALRTGLAAR
jgi:acetyl esterase/lipase